MKKLLFLGTILLCASNTFAIELEKGKNERTDKVVLVCRTVSAINEDGEIVASASCCKTYPSELTGTDAVIAGATLTICAEEKLEQTLAGN